jgi:hypothetical protein
MEDIAHKRIWHVEEIVNNLLMLIEAHVGQKPGSEKVAGGRN